MGFNKKIKYFLVHHLHCSNKEAQQLIENGRVDVNGFTVSNNCLIDTASEIKVDGQVKRSKKEFVYLKFNKPPGFESTLNTGVPNNIAEFFKHYEGLSIAGRLDKQSRGLLLLSNDGQWVERICHPKFEKEKRYEVELNRDVDASFLTTFEAGVQLSNYLTKPCECQRVGERRIHVVLKEGKNRQIRRMCKALGRTVISLRRTDIANLQIGHLEEGQSETIQPDALQ